MVCQRSTVMAVNVNTDSSLANTCESPNQPSALQIPTPFGTGWSRRAETHREKSSNVAAEARLPVDGMVVVLVVSEYVHGCYNDQVDAHAEVSEGQVAHKKTRNRQLGAVT